MGYGNYSFDAHAALTAGRVHQARTEVFKQTQCHALMNPKGLKVRECRDSVDHPDSLGIAFALDVTGSMGDIPHLLAKQELPSFMKLLTACGVVDPQLMFMAIGDATSDHAALQIGQFESTAELMDQWLTWSYLEGGGGGTGQESATPNRFEILEASSNNLKWVRTETATAHPKGCSRLRLLRFT